jgi:hypothetical protein
MADRSLPVLFCYDHNTADKEKMGIQPGEVLESAKYSPDMHKPIEHAWGWLKESVQQQLLAPKAKSLTARAAQELVYNTWLRLPKAGVFRDVETLPLTYMVICGAAGEAREDDHGNPHTCSGGDWPARAYR